MLPLDPLKLRRTTLERSLLQNLFELKTELGSALMKIYCIHKALVDGPWLPEFPQTSLNSLDDVLRMSWALL